MAHETQILRTENLASGYGEADVIAHVDLSLAAGEILAVEKDPRLVACLTDNLHAWGVENVTVVQGDALKVRLPEPDLVVSNLPYKISSPVTFRLLELGFRKAVCLYQKEFALRMTAPPGTKDYGRLSIRLFYHADCEIAETVPATAFFPRPRVESSMVAITGSIFILVLNLSSSRTCQSVGFSIATASVLSNR